MAKTPSSRQKPDPKPSVDLPEIDLSAEDAEILNETPEAIIEDPKDDPTPIEDGSEPVSPSPAITDNPVKSGSGFLPLVLGGLVAGGLGFGAAWTYLPKNDAAVAALTDQVTNLQAQIETLKAESTAQSDVAGRLDALKREQGMAISVLENRLNGIETDLGAMPVSEGAAPTSDAALGQLETTLGGRLDALKREQGMAISVLENRLNAVESGAAPNGTVSQAAGDAVEAEIEALRAELAARTAQMQGLAQDTAAQLEQARTSAAQIEQSAVEAARSSTLRVALARVQSAMESGASYSLDLPDLAAANGGTLSAAITGPAESGIPTVLALQEAYPEAARAALATARSEGVSGEDESTVTGFLRTMFDVRSVEPRNGTTTDAILSRAEAALREGRLVDTVAEIASLPEVARAEFSEWSALAQSRLDALAAVEALSLTLPEN